MRTVIVLSMLMMFSVNIHVSAANSSLNDGYPYAEFSQEQKKQLTPVLERYIDKFIQRTVLYGTGYQQRVLEKIETVAETSSNVYQKEIARIFLLYAPKVRDIRVLYSDSTGIVYSVHRRESLELRACWLCQSPPGILRTYAYVSRDGVQRKSVGVFIDFGLLVTDNPFSVVNISWKGSTVSFEASWSGDAKKMEYFGMDGIWYAKVCDKRKQFIPQLSGIDRSYNMDDPYYPVYTVCPISIDIIKTAMSTGLLYGTYQGSAFTLPIRSQ